METEEGTYLYLKHFTRRSRRLSLAGQITKWILKNLKKTPLEIKDEETLWKTKLWGMEIGKFE